jgi:hypothetical protein
MDESISTEGLKIKATIEELSDEDTKNLELLSKYK